MIVLRAVTITFLLLKSIVLLAFRIFGEIGSKNKHSFYDLLGKSVTNLIEDLGPTFIKIGQLLSTRRDLFAPEILSQLVSLQDDLTPIPFEYLYNKFWDDFNLDIEKAFIEISKKPVASASIASVFKGRLVDNRTVALKIRRPDIARTIEKDIRLINSLINVVPLFPFMRSIPLREIFDEISESVIRQVDFETEAYSNGRLTEALKHEELVFLPSLVEAFCSKSILTMEYFEELENAKVQPTPIKKQALSNGLRALYRMIFIEGFVHCDMHPANFHLLDEGKVILIDFGLIAELESKDRLSFAEFFYAMVVNDGYTCSEITLETASFIPRDFDKDSFSEEIVSLVDKYSGQKVTGFQVSGFVVGMFDIQRKHKIRGTTAFIMAIISLLVFEGVAKTVDPGLDFQTLSIPYIQEALNMRRRI